MADQSSQEKSEKASAQKLRKAREQGQVARSRDLATALGILVTLKLTIILWPDYLDDFRRLFLQSFVSLDGDGTLDNVWSEMLSNAFALLLKMLLPLAVLPLIVAAGSLIPGGWVFSSTHLQPNFSRLSPMKNIGRLFSYKHARGVLASMLKALCMCGMLYYVVHASYADYLRLQSRTLDQALIHGTALMVDGAMALCMVFVLFAVFDVPLQWVIFLREQRMSKLEVKEEYKSNEGRPEVRQRIRQILHQLARRSVRKTVPTADVLIVNPEHYAVALKYDAQRAEAPFVVAKGVDEMALYMRSIAEEHGIEVLELPPLARAIYNTSQVNQQIPAALYAAVAQVLNYVLQLKAFQSGRRNTQPLPPSDLSVPAHLT